MIHNLFFFIIAIGVLVTFHELGHYWLARWLNVKVLRFSVGFGKPLISWRRQRGQDEIEYAIAAIPLGGYVKMVDEREGPVAESDRTRAFNTQPVYKRFLIVAAGPLFNFILAIAFYWLVFMNGVDGFRPLINAPVKDSPAYEAGLQQGDEILAVNGTSVKTWDSLRLALINYGIDGGVIRLTVKTADELETGKNLEIGDREILNKKADVLSQLGLSLWEPKLPTVIGGVLDNSAAKEAGLDEDDRVLSINGQAVTTWDQLVNTVRANPGKSLDFEVQRNNKTRHVTVIPNVKQSDGVDVGYLGAYANIPKEIADKRLTRVEYGFFGSFVRAAEETWNMSSLTLRVFGKMLLGEAALENISGPITIATYAGITASMGFLVYIKFLAMISVSLGVLNLLPVPMLDGGHLFYYLIEMIKGSPVSDQFQEIGQQIGLVLLLMLMGLAIFNDIQRLVN